MNTTKKAQEMLSHLNERRAGGSTGQGPFKHSLSAERALFGVMQAVHDIKLALGRIDPAVADLDGVKRGNDNALLAGLEILMQATERMAHEADRHLKNLSSADAPPKNWKPGDPPKKVGPPPKNWKAGERDEQFKPAKLKDELQQMHKLTRAVYSDLQFHRDCLKGHVVTLETRLTNIEDIYAILKYDVDEAKTQTLSRIALSSPRGGGSSSGGQSVRERLEASCSTHRGGSAAGGAGGGAATPRPMIGSLASMGGYSAHSFKHLPSELASVEEGTAAWRRLQVKKAVAVDFVGADAAAAATGAGAMTPGAHSPSKLPSPNNFTARVAVAGSIASSVPWTPNEDLVLIALVRRDGLHRWPRVAEDFHAMLVRSFPDEAKHLHFEARAHARASGLCKARWETLLNAYLSVAGVAGVNKTSDLLLAARKASRLAELSMNEVAGRLNDAKSKLSLAGVMSRQVLDAEAQQRAQLRDKISVRVHGHSAEHARLRTLVEELGPLKLLHRKLEEVNRKQSGDDSDTIEQSLRLTALSVETGKLGASSVGGRPRHYLRVRDTVTGEIALYWEEPRDARETKPSETYQGKLTRTLHDGGGGGDRSSLASGSVRGSVCGSAAGSVCSAPSTPR
jgi:hypothetical protein